MVLSVLCYRMSLYTAVNQNSWCIVGKSHWQANTGFSVNSLGCWICYIYPEDCIQWNVDDMYITLHHLWQVILFIVEEKLCWLTAALFINRSILQAVFKSESYYWKHYLVQKSYYFLNPLLIWIKFHFCCSLYSCGCFLSLVFLFVFHIMLLPEASVVFQVLL